MFPTIWYNCAISNFQEYKIECKGGYSNAMDADKEKISGNYSTLIPVCKYQPEFLIKKVLKYKYMENMKWLNNRDISYLKYYTIII